MTADVDPSDDVPSPEDSPDLDEVADAILDGRPINWDGAQSGPAAGFVGELRVLADLAAAHRLSPESAGESPSRRHLPPSTPIGQWGSLQILERIAAGAFGEVFRAWDPRLDREVALKLLFAEDEEALGADAVIEEGRLLARVRHPNVVTVYGAERADGRVGVWTEFIRGRTLAEEIAARGPFTADEAAKVGIELARALSAVHQAGLLHRDIKPHNVMRDEDGRLVLLDFGAGRERLDDPAAGAIDTAGTPLYVAPELWKGEAATHQSDIYSVGVLLFHLVTGTYPVKGAKLSEVRDAHQRGLPSSSVRSERPDLPNRLGKIIDRAIAREPGQRHLTAAALEGELLGLAGGNGRQARTGRGWWAAAFLLAAAAAIYAVTLAIRPATPPAESRRRVPSDIYGIFSGPSRDGRYATFIDMEEGNVWLVKTDTGKARRVTNGAAEKRMATSSRPSPDGARVAYSWGSRDGPFELWISRADGSGARALLSSAGSGLPRPLEWSSNGTAILCFLDMKDGRRDLALVSTDGSPTRTIASFRGTLPGFASLSPDGTFVAFDDVAAPGQKQHDIFIMKLGDPSSRRSLQPHPASDTFPLWASDGRIVFLSDRAGRIDAWAWRVVNGAAVGDAVVVASGMDGATPAGLSAGGTMFYVQLASTVDVHTMEVDIERPNSLTTPVPLPGERLGERTGGTWSPDGKWLGYNDRRENQIGLVDLQSGKHTKISPPIKNMGNFPPRWSPDSKYVLTVGNDRENRRGIFQWEIARDQLTPALLADSSEAAEVFPPPVAWSSDSKSILYFALEGMGSARGILRRTISTGEMSQVVAPEDLPVSRGVRIAMSRDGRSLAVSGQVSRGKSIESGLWVRTDNGPFRRILVGSRLVVFQEWTFDQRYLLFTQELQGTTEWHLWVVPPTGGTPRSLGQLPGYSPNNRAVYLSPDMRRVGYVQGLITHRPWMVVLGKPS